MIKRSAQVVDRERDWSILNSPEHRQKDTYQKLEIQTVKISPERISTNSYLFQRHIIASFINCDHDRLERIISGEEKSIIITGFGLTGLPHLGTKIIRDELEYFLCLGNKIFICVSSADASTRNLSLSQTEKNQSAIEKFFVGLSKNPACQFLRSELIDQIVKKVDWDDSLIKKIFEQHFLIDYCTKMGHSIAYMTKSVIGISQAHKSFGNCVIPLGIDELDIAQFITNATKRLAITTPIFIFNQIVPGYKSEKMGKSIPESSFVFLGSFDEEFSKIEPFIGGLGHPVDAACSLCDVIFYSGYPLNIADDVDRQIAHQNAKEILFDIFHSL